MIRKYRTTDTDAIVRAYYNASKLAHPFLTEEFLQKVMCDIPELYLPNTETWIAEEEGAVAGFLSLMGNEVAALFLEPDYHGKGIGRALMDKAVLEKGDLEVVVFKENAIGRAFYDRYGFKKIDEFPFEETGDLCFRMAFKAA
ncbi:putative acetyltransferase [Aestuariispira insulae]|uniref:Putative acetyltransferase n=1 Tax=Aestuariispira insulae TaxID=1461337 RepID=A0A3D9HP70_9PROT|nr:putative acetyltransferase [Aestuariispira insulae]